MKYLILFIVTSISAFGGFSTSFASAPLFTEPLLSAVKNPNNSYGNFMDRLESKDYGSLNGLAPVLKDKMKTYTYSLMNKMMDFDDELKTNWNNGISVGELKIKSNNLCKAANSDIQKYFKTSKLDGGTAIIFVMKDINYFCKDESLFIDKKFSEFKKAETFSEKKDRILKSMGRNNSTLMNLLKSNDKIYSKLSSVQKKSYDSLVGSPMNIELMNIYKNFDSSISQKTILQKGTVVKNKYTLIAKKISPSAIQLVNNNYTSFPLIGNEFFKK